MCTLSFPITVLQVINNAMMETWRTESILSLVILAFNLAFDVKGIMSIQDRMTQDKNDQHRKRLMKRMNI